MRVENVLSGLQSVGFNELKSNKTDSATKSTNDIKVTKEEISREIKTNSAEDIASRNVLAQNTQDEITKYQIAQAGLNKQVKAMERAKTDILEGKYDTLEDINSRIDLMKNEIAEISDKTTFQNVKLFEGDNGESFQIPSVRLGGKNYLPLHDLKIETREDLTNAMATIESAITKINNEIVNCKTSIDEKANAMTSHSGLSYVDASVAREIMESLKSEIYTRGQEMIRSQNVSDKNVY